MRRTAPRNRLTALAPRSSEADKWPPRSDGALIWCHVGTPEQRAAMLGLGRRLRAQRPEPVQVLLTVDAAEDGANGETDTGATVQEDGTIICTLGTDRARLSLTFQEHWRPDFALWAGGSLRPMLIEQLAAKGVPMMMADAVAPGAARRILRWRRTREQSAMHLFSRLIVPNPAAAEPLLRLGIAPEKLIFAPRLRSGGGVPPACDDDYVSEVSQTLAGRPVWLAAQIAPQEIEAVIAAHRAALRLSHRLLLVTSPARLRDAAHIAETVRASGLRCADWSDGEEPDDYTQVLLCEGGPDLALWYRLSPVVFLGGSLEPPGPGHDPFDAAALGSALLYGPHVGDHAPAFARLAAAGAARRISDASTLAEAVGRLIAPDQAAAMALAGWEVVSESAPVIDALLDAINDALDRAVRR